MTDINRPTGEQQLALLQRIIAQKERAIVTAAMHWYTELDAYGAESLQEQAARNPLKHACADLRQASAPAPHDA